MTKLQHRWLSKSRMTQNLDCRLIQLFCRSKSRVLSKKSVKHYLIVIKKDTFMQIQEDVAEQLGLPRPSEHLESNPNKTVNCKARNFYFWKNACLMKFYKCC